MKEHRTGHTRNKRAFLRSAAASGHQSCGFDICPRLCACWTGSLHLIFAFVCSVINKLPIHGGAWRLRMGCHETKTFTHTHTMDDLEAPVQTAGEIPHYTGKACTFVTYRARM